MCTHIHRPVGKGPAMDLPRNTTQIQISECTQDGMESCSTLPKGMAGSAHRTMLRLGCDGYHTLDCSTHFGPQHALGILAFHQGLEEKVGFRMVEHRYAIPKTALCLPQRCYMTMSGGKSWVCGNHWMFWTLGSKIRWVRLTFQASRTIWSTGLQKRRHSGSNIDGLHDRRIQADTSRQGQRLWQIVTGIGSTTVLIMRQVAIRNLNSAGPASEWAPVGWWMMAPKVMTAGAMLTEVIWTLLVQVLQGSVGSVLALQLAGQWMDQVWVLMLLRGGVGHGLGTQQVSVGPLAECWGN
mmetsp:Transcript_94371/g.163124  ORF Transcript_94371/g.163124 Transcript_94371/m.163124 type:complete len:296 (+) Transcript_94371:434-1321(+)